MSSSAIRRAVCEGRLTDAARLLGRPFALAGEIQPGTGQGRRVVVPTLNLRTAQELLPKTGVYSTEVRVTGQKYRSVTNVGMRPTFDGKALTVESYLFDFDEQLTAGPMEVSFCARLRNEMKFSGPEALRTQILLDGARSRRFFGFFDRLTLKKQSVRKNS